MIVRTGKTTNLEIIEYEGLSTDDRDILITNGTVAMNNLGSTFFCVDSSDVYKLNTEPNGTELKWYKL